MKLSIFGDEEKTLEALSATITSSVQDQLDLLSLRNSLLFFKALKKERVMETYISLQAFDHYRSNYRQFIRDENQ